MLTAHSKMSRTPASKPGCYPILPLIPEKLSVEDEKDRLKYLKFHLKSRAGAPENSTKYKKSVRIFEEGTPQEWIELMVAVEEIWKQNIISGGADRVANLQSLIRGQSKVTFEVSLDEARMDAQGAHETICDTHITTALNAVANTIFPYHALNQQIRWMQHKMKKPYEMSTRRCAAALSQLNNSLRRFPGGTEESKFSESELVGMLEWCLPESFRNYFDSKLYIPTDHTRMRLIVESEAIEQQQLADKPNFKEKIFPKKFDRSVNGKNRKTNYSTNKFFYCSEHGTNPTHATSDCFTLKNRKAGNQGTVKGTQATQRTWTKKSFSKELNLMSRSKPKKEVLDLCASVIKQQQTDMAKRNAKRKKDTEVSSESSSENSLDMINPIPRKKAFKKVKTATETGNNSEEELAYKLRVALIDVGGNPTDKNQDTSPDNSD